MIFPYPYGIVHAETGDAKFPGEAFGRILVTNYPAVGKPMERRKRVAVPGGGCPGVRA